MLKLIQPSIEYREQILNYKKEFLLNSDSMAGTAGLERCGSFEEWLQNVYANSINETVHEGLVPETVYLAIRTEDNHLVGMIEIRHELNDFLLQHGGNISYSVRITERRRGYAIEMLNLALIESKKLGLRRVLITCDKKNIASAKTVLKNGAVLENEVDEGSRITQRYWIEI